MVPDAFLLTFRRHRDSAAERAWSVETSVGAAHADSLLSAFIKAVALPSRRGASAASDVPATQEQGGSR